MATQIIQRDTMLERQRAGFDGVSLTEWEDGNTNRPEIAAGSVIEVDGSLFEYTADTAIVDGAGLVDGWVYIEHVVGAGPPATLVPTFRNAFGTWDAARNGFYTGDNKFSFFAMVETAGVFTEKCVIANSQGDIGYIVDGVTTFNAYVSGANCIDSGSAIYPTEAIQQKIISITIPNASGNATAAHGITNAYTNDRIISISIVCKDTTGSYLTGGASETVGVGSFTIYYWRADNANLQIYRGESVGAYAFRCLISYV